MTDLLTEDEHDYYVEMLVKATRIFEDALGGTVTPKSERNLLIHTVFDKIASPLHYLREEPQPEKGVKAPSKGVTVVTQFKKATKPNPQGMTEYTYADNVKSDLMQVLQYLRVQGNELKSYGGRVYALSFFNGRDYLWRKKEAEK